jgi:hypothetical protein
MIKFLQMAQIFLLLCFISAFLFTVFYTPNIIDIKEIKVKSKIVREGDYVQYYVSAIKHLNYIPTVKRWISCTDGTIGDIWPDITGGDRPVGVPSCMPREVKLPERITEGKICQVCSLFKYDLVLGQHTTKTKCSDYFAVKKRGAY